MKRLIGVGLLVLVVGAATLPSDAASPKSGTLSKGKKKLSWKGSFQQSNPSGFVVDGELVPASNCQEPVLTCDHFKLKINMGKGGRVKIVIPVTDGVSDIDFRVINPAGVNVTGTDGGQGFYGESEVAQFTVDGKFRNKAYDVQIAPFLVVPGLKYKATASITKFVK